MKQCSKCNETKELTEFHKDKGCRQGVKNTCKVCKLKSKKEWYTKNKEEIVEKAKEYRINNPDKCRQARKKWDSANVGMVRAKEARRRAAKLERRVAWADEDLIKEVYNQAAYMRKELGMDVHVDHIIPLRGKYVSGLHVGNNLQIIPATTNLAKGNRYGA